MVDRHLAMAPTLDDVILSRLSSFHKMDALLSLICFMVVSGMYAALLSFTTMLAL